MENEKLSNKNKTLIGIVGAILVVVLFVIGYNYGKNKALEDNERDRLELQKK